ncbi:MAG: aquaporin [Acidobacteria bacterium]|nr:aquaporin [Acidobacteriota bacterium]
MKDGKIVGAEALGTFILMLGGPGTAVLANQTDWLGGATGLAIALGFGFALLIAAYAIGPISGCHINPAVTIGLVAAKKVDPARVPAYILGQLIGAVVGGGIVLLIARGAPGGFSPVADNGINNFAANLWTAEFGFFDFGSMAIVEVLLTALLVFVVLSTTIKKFAPGAIGLAVGITLTVIHLISIPVDNTSVNPARSLGMAVYAQGAALEQLWAFIILPIIGAIIGAGVWMLLNDESDDAVFAND